MVELVKFDPRKPCLLWVRIIPGHSIQTPGILSKTNENLGFHFLILLMTPMVVINEDSKMDENYQNVDTLSVKLINNTFD